VTKNDIEARLLDEDRIPEDAVTKADDAVGKITKENIQSGQLVSRFDLSSRAKRLRN
jgi:flagella basal body P-ring formation protein FlgA